MFRCFECKITFSMFVCQIGQCQSHHRHSHRPPSFQWTVCLKSNLKNRNNQIKLIKQADKRVCVMRNIYAITHWEVKSKGKNKLCAQVSVNKWNSIYHSMKYMCKCELEYVLVYHLFIHIAQPVCASSNSIFDAVHVYFYGCDQSNKASIQHCALF